MGKLFMLLEKPLVGTVSQWKKIFTGIDFMGEDPDVKYKYVPRPDIYNGKSNFVRYLEYLKIKRWLIHPPKEPKRKFTEF